MPPAKKRKTAAKSSSKKKNHVVTATASSPPPAESQPPADEPAEEAPPAPEVAEERPLQPDTSSDPKPVVEPAQPSEPAPDPEPEPEPEPAPKEPSPAPAPAATLSDRMARFKALKARSQTSSASNLAAAQTEAHRQKNDPAQLQALKRKGDVANYKLLKADIEDAGGDFERKRAWDWTIDESEKWDERMAERAAHRDNNAFSDYRSEANKSYERQVKNLGGPDLEKYTAEKMRAIEEAARRGTLEIVETEDGEMVAVDKDGTFYGGGGGSGDVISSFVDNKPDKKAVDRLVAEMRKSDEVAAKKRKERAARNGDDADVTYINDKNKQFNQKLSRFYNKYTAEIRDSFERGTRI